ncbi:Glyco-hydro-38C domain-containing protein [Paenibacillus nuruki]|nr:Glyco-hydro-38C domain-containing protein [Paenibacillus nuruki]
MALVNQRTSDLKKFYRMTFEMRKTQPNGNSGALVLHTLLVNPSDFNQDEQARGNIIQTLGGAYVQDFGLGLPTVTISGTTGYSIRSSAEHKKMDGFEELTAFRSRIYRKFLQANDPQHSLYWYNWEDDEYYEIQPQDFRVQRSKSEPTLYRYEFRFTCLRRLTKTRKEAAEDYLKRNPSTKKIADKLANNISNIGEFLNKVTGG